MKLYFMAMLFLLKGISLGAMTEKSFYLGDQRFSVIIKGEELINMLGMNPNDSKTIKLSIVEVAKLANEGISNFNKENQTKGLYMEKVSLSRFHEFSNGKVIWLWEVGFFYGNHSGSVQRISLFVTKDGKIIMPQLRHRK